MKSTPLTVTSSDEPAAAPVSLDAAQTRKIVLAAYIGTALEWYDFFLFGTVAAIVFAPLFFPGDVPAISIMRLPQLWRRLCCTATGGSGIRSHRRQVRAA